MQLAEFTDWLEREKLDEGTSYIGHSYYLIRNTIANCALASAYLLDEQILDFTPMRDYVLILTNKAI